MKSRAFALSVALFLVLLSIPAAVSAHGLDHPRPFPQLRLHAGARDVQPLENRVGYLQQTAL